MKEIEKIADKFSHSSIFIPNFEFTWKVREYLEDRINAEQILAKMKYDVEIKEQLHGVVFDLKKEAIFLEEVINDLISLTNSYIKEMTFSSNTLNEFLWHTQIGIPFRNKTFQLYLAKILSLIVQYINFKSVLSLKQNRNIPNDLNQYYNYKDNLVDVSDFEILNKGFWLKSQGIVIYPDISYDLKMVLLPFFANHRDASRLQIRPGSYGTYKEYSSVDWIFEERIFGIPFNTNNLRKICLKEYGQFEYILKTEKDRLIARGFNIPLKRLEYVIKPYDAKNLTLSIEEVIDIEKTDYLNLNDFVYSYDKETFILQRYFHVIFDRENYEINHMDLSHLYYNFDSYCQRIETHLKEKTVPASIKVKKFRLDGGISFNDFQSILIPSLDAKRNPEIINFVTGK